MTEAELNERINELEVTRETELVLSFIENENEVSFNGRIEFLNSGLPAISNNRVGIRIQLVKGAADMPYPGGVSISNMISIDLRNE